MLLQGAARQHSKGPMDWGPASPAPLWEGGPRARARAGGGGGDGGGTKRGCKKAAKAPGSRRAAGGAVAHFRPSNLSDVTVETDVLAGKMVHFCCCRKSGHCKAELEGIVKRLGGKVRSPLCNQSSRRRLGVACAVPCSRRTPVCALWLATAGSERKASAGSSAALSEASDVAGCSRKGARRPRAQVAQNHCSGVTHVIASPAEAEGPEWRMWVNKDVIRLDWLLQCSTERAYVRLRPRHYLARDPAAIAADPRVDCYGDECGPPPAWQSNCISAWGRWGRRARAYVKELERLRHPDALMPGGAVASRHGPASAVRMQHLCAGAPEVRITLYVRVYPMIGRRARTQVLRAQHGGGHRGHCRPHARRGHGHPGAGGVGARGARDRVWPRAQARHAQAWWLRRPHAGMLCTVLCNVRRG